MSERIDIASLDPNAFKAVLGLEKYASNTGLEKSLYELIKIRASQINGCAYCLDMHQRDARDHGEDQRRLDILSAWREAPDFFTPRERAALAMTEAITLIRQDGVPDDVWQQAAREFSDEELVWVVMSVSVINVWNRMAISVHQALPDLND
ncbi:MAG TPA: carboxymuconolactone decarboxylase family protein [Beutenbergiaceae bacterium]|nr:carboxymuconolactone decarboxylase family protein [Beutenbergiaceae bacterium]